nr:MAG TPA: hypothetical protein [Caudoviricetes sp.]DAP79137.1 MAG TPA: hypothetical protein [Caudoviricetes sp.]
MSNIYSFVKNLKTTSCIQTVKLYNEILLRFDK